jgi:hypothetical protein
VRESLAPIVPRLDSEGAAVKCSRISLEAVAWYWKIGIETCAADSNTLTENMPNSVN